MKDKADTDYTFKKAQCVTVLKSDASDEFLESRKNVWDWKWYKARCRMRHQWGRYLQSSLDWDWDIANCLERLFELPEEVVASPDPIATVDLDAEEAGTWKVSTETCLPKKMKVAYKSATGETKHKTIWICPSSDDVVSGQADWADEVRNRIEPLATSPEVSCAGGEAAERLGVIAPGNRNAAASADIDLGLGGMRVVEKQEEVSLITEESSCGINDEAGERSEPVTHEASDASLTQVIGDTSKENIHGVDTNEVDLVELVRRLELIQEQYADQISICSLD